MSTEPSQSDEAIEAHASRERPKRGPDLASELREGKAPPTLVAALIAWAITVAPVGFSRGHTAISATAAVLALAAGAGGPFLLARRPKIGRHVGISLFLAFSLGAWMANAGAIHPLRLEPLRGVFGAIAWGIFALSWSDRWSGTPTAQPADPDAPSLLARSALPPLAAPIAWIAVIASLVYLVLAFRVREPERALVAQALALACSIGVVSAGATVAVARGKPRSSAGRFTPPAIRALLFLVTFGVGGVLVMALR
jgi:hypothetical protein